MLPLDGLRAAPEAEPFLVLQQLGGQGPQVAVGLVAGHGARASAGITVMRSSVDVRDIDLDDQSVLAEHPTINAAADRSRR